MKKVFFLLICLCASFVLVAQTKVITGSVVDAGREALIGVSISEQGHSNGTVTGSDGTFSLKVSATGKLVFSYLGFVTQEISFNESTNKLDIVMKEDALSLDEIVVTGYGSTQKRTKLTNSIATVKEEMFETGLFSNPAQALSGAVAGLKVTQSSGNPGSAPTVILRGGTNLDGSGSPLVMVDGQIRSSLSDINSEDIASMEVLKDAGATALYGARAANGVILITTKRGKEGKTQFTVKAKSGLNYLNNPFDFMNAGDYLYWVRNAIKNGSQIWQDQAGNWKGSTTMSSLTGVSPYGTGNLYWDPSNPSAALDGNKDGRAIWSPMILNDQNRALLSEGWKTMKDPIYGDEIIYKDFNYMKSAFNNPSLTQDYNMSMSGGSDKGSYYAGLGYYDAEGLPIDTYYRRLTFTFNGDYKIKSWLTSYSTFNYADAKWKDVNSTSEANYFARMLSTPPTMRGYNASGDLLLGPNTGDGNPAKTADAFIRNNNTDKFTMGQSFKFDVIKGLYLKASALWMYDEAFNEAFNKDYMTSPGNWNRTRTSSASFDRTIRQTYNLIANYDTKIAEKHTLGVLVGMEYFDSYNKGFSASGSDAPTDDFMDLVLTSTAENKRSIDSWHTRQRILSFMGKLSYDYKDKYLLSATARRDGYSLLIDNRWGFFPGVSGGWVLTKEDFMANMLNLISYAKLRASYGVNGNVSGLGAYTLQGSYGTAKFNGSTGYLLTGIPNPGIRWERSKTFETGVDVGILNSLVNLGLTYYNRITDDKFANIPLPGSSGITSILSNNGTLQNRGIEAELNFRIIQNKDWKWQINTNFSYNENKILKLPDNGLEKNRQSAFQVYDPATGQLMWVGGYQEGQVPGAIYAFKSNGIFKSEDEIMKVAANRIDKTTGNNGSNGRTLYGPSEWNKLTDAQKALGFPIQPGDVNWEDVNGDGVIDNFDQVYVGNSIPKWTGGFTNTLSWKGLTLFARMDFALGHKQVDNIRPWFMGMMQGTYNSLADTKNSWTPDNVDAAYPKYYWADQLGKRNYARQSSMFIYDASYLCFREVSLSYDLPKSLVQKIRLEGIQLSVTGQNLGYVTKSKVFTPEVGGGIGGGYPLPRTVIFGASLTF